MDPSCDFSARLESLFDEACSLDADKRIAFARAATESDRQLREELLSLLSFSESSQGVLDGGAAKDIQAVARRLFGGTPQPDVETNGGVESDSGAVCAQRTMPARSSSLEDWTAGIPGVMERILLLERIAIAVKGIQDRDRVCGNLNPGTIRVDDSGGPVLPELGHACRETESPLRMTRGELVRSLQYMSPEQAAGRREQVGFASDVYALGVIAYQLLAHRMPYELVHLPLAQAIRTVQHFLPPPLGTIDGRLKGPLEEIVAKALEKQPERRYASAADFAAALRGYLNACSVA